MRDSGYWIVLSVGWDSGRPRGRRWDALVVSVQPADEVGEPDPKALAAVRPGRLVVWGLWAPFTGWTMAGQEGPPRLVERFVSAGIFEKTPFKSAVALGIGAAMRLALGLSDRDRDPFPSQGAN